MCRYVSIFIEQLSHICEHILRILSAQCIVLHDPANGMVTTTSRRLSGSTAKYNCNSGFELLDLTSGSNVRTCQTDGTWSGSKQKCISKWLVSMEKY